MAAPGGLADDALAPGVKWPRTTNVITDGPDSQRATARRAAPRLDAHGPPESSIGSWRVATLQPTSRLCAKPPSIQISNSQRAHPSEPLLCSRHVPAFRAAPWLAKHDGLQGKSHCEAISGQFPGSMVVCGALPVCFVTHSARRLSGLHPGCWCAVALWVALGLRCPATNQPACNLQRPSKPQLRS